MNNNKDTILLIHEIINDVRMTNNRLHQLQKQLSKSKLIKPQTQQRINITKEKLDDVVFNVLKILKHTFE